MADRLPGNWHNIQSLLGPSYLCGYCNVLVGTNAAYHIAETPNKYYIRICPKCNRPTFIEEGRQTPGVSFGNPAGHLPKEVEPLYDEARICTAVGAHTAAVLAARKILMHLAVEKEAKPGLSFIDYVEYLAEKGFVPPNGKGWVDYIRKKGNEANHQILLMNEEDSKKLITFLEMLLKFIYEFPAEIPKSL